MNLVNITYMLGYAVTQVVEALRRKVADSIPDVVTGIFHWRKPSGRTMALELTQPLT
jgi:hypothetical protein